MGQPPPGTLPTVRSPEDRLHSWKEIAAYLSHDVTTVQRWEKREGMPVHRHLHDRMGSVYAFRAELDGWMCSRKLRARPEERESLAARPSPPMGGISHSRSGNTGKRSCTRCRRTVRMREWWLTLSICKVIRRGRPTANRSPRRSPITAPHTSFAYRSTVVPLLPLSRSTRSIPRGRPMAALLFTRDLTSALDFL